ETRVPVSPSTKSTSHRGIGNKTAKLCYSSRYFAGDTLLTSRNALRGRLRHCEEIHREAGSGDGAERRERDLVTGGHNDGAGDDVRERCTYSGRRGYCPEADVEVAGPMCEVLHDEGKQRPKDAGSDAVQQLH